jgi:aldehyde dehydrogenase (NAD+)
MQEEIFGPLLPILKYENLDEAIHYINSKPKPLALYCFSKDNKFSSKLERETTSGAFIINDCVIHHANPNLPFGGINNSGLGSYHGKYGFDELSHQKSIMKSSYFSPFKLILPPYSQFKKNLVNLINKIL